MRRCLTIGLFAAGLACAASAQGYGYNHSYGYGQNDYGYHQKSAPVDNCTTQRKDGQTGGAIVGGLLGALAGGAIGNNIDGNDKYRQRRRGYRGYGYNNYYGYGRHRGHHRKNDNSGNVAAGAIVGGLLGAVAGSEVGKRNVKCRTYHDNVQTRGYRGDPSIAPPTRHAWPEQTGSYPVAQPAPVYRQSQPTTTRTVRTYPEPTPQPQTRAYRNDDLYGGERSLPCESVTRVTRLPDGRQIREEVQDCQTGEVWYERDGQRVQGGY